MPIPHRSRSSSYNRLEDLLATPRRPRNLPAARPNPLRDLVTQKARAADANRERRRVQELKSELPSIIQDRVGEHIQKLETKLLSEVKELSQRTIEESTAAISSQLSGRIDTLEQVSKMQTDTLESLRDSSQIAERKVSDIVTQIEKSLASAVPGFALDPPKTMPPPASPGSELPCVRQDSGRSPQLSNAEPVSGALHAIDPPMMLQMPAMPVGDRLKFTSVALISNGVHPQFQPEPPMEIIEADPLEIEEVVGRHGFCPNCTSVDVRRANRKGIFETFLRLFSIAPFRCRACRHKFYRF